MTDSAPQRRRRFLPFASLAATVCAICLIGLFSASQAAAQRQYRQDIYLSGFKCVSLPRDSVLLPSHEIFFLVVTNTPQNAGIQSRSVGAFKGVKKGFGRRTRNLVWSGPPQPLSFRVAMFEQDAGGETGQTMARVMAEMVGAYVGRSGKTPTRSGSNLARDNQAEPGIVRDFGKGISRLFGLGHDLLGYDRQIFGTGDWSQKPTYREREIPYHFYTTHRHKGASCRAYFLIERGLEIKKAPDPELQRPAPRQDPPSAPQGGYNPSAPAQTLPPDYEVLGPDPLLPPPPAPLPPPPEPEPDWFRARFRNSCDTPISLSYAYKNPSRGWVKRGWALMDPGQSLPMEGNTLTPEIYIHTSRGRVSGSFDPEEIILSVRNKGFDTNRAKVFRGDKGAREAPYKLHALSDISGTELIPIVDCNDWASGRLVDQQLLARNKQISEYNARQARVTLNSSLDDAAFAGDISGIKKALAAGADIENRSNRLSVGRSTPLHLAVTSFNGKAIDLLLDKGADATKVNREGGTALHAAVKAYKTSRFFDDFPIKSFERLIKAGVDPDVKDKDGQTALGLLVRYLHPLNVKDRVVETNDQARSGKDLLAFLAAHTTQDLDRQHARGSSYRSITALHLAAISGHRALADALIANGADLSITDANGKTARELAAPWPLEFQELFGPLPQPKPDPVVTAPQESASNPAPSATRPAPRPVDPAAIAERCRKIIARGLIKADQCEVPN